MSNICKYFIEGRLTADPVLRQSGKGDAIVEVNVASTIGYGDNAKTVYHKCSAFKQSAEAINKHFKKGDQIIIFGEPTQNKKDDKVYYGVRITDWQFGQKKDGSKTSNSKDFNEFNDDDISF